MNEIHGEVTLESLFDLFGFAFAHHSSVDKHTRQLITNGAMHEGRGHRRINTPGKPADHSARSNLLADFLHGFVEN
jgi:hypothetical protein